MTTTTTTTTTTADPRAARYDEHGNLISEPLGGAFDDKNHASGRLMTISGSTITVKTGPGAPSAYSIAHDAEVTFKGKPGRREDLKQGMQVDLTLVDGSVKKLDATSARNF